MVFYRKYRPQLISELDLLSVREKLSSILSSKNLPHAFLFTGPKGLGKTSSARILAKAINCEKRSVPKNKKLKTKEKSLESSVLSSEGIEPCNECSACLSITNGSNIDVLEIDAASNRGIDEIRELRERIKFTPAALHKKVYIIDEVHMLTTEAFNALLKTLEEPPSHVVFILATTEFWKLPGTIVSRAFHVQFEKPDKKQIASSLWRIVKGEKLETDQEVLEDIASLADGAFRDAAKILEELVLASENGKITKELLEKTYKTESIDREVMSLVMFLGKKDTQQALTTLNSLAQNGCDFKVVNEKIVEALRLLLLKKSGVPAEIQDVDALQVSEIKVLLEYFNTSYKDIRTSVLPQLPLELAVVKYCVVDEAPRTPSDSLFRASKLQEPNSIQVQNDQPSSKYLPAGKAGQIPDTKPEKHVPVQTVRASQQSDETFLKALIDRVKRDNFSVAGILRSFRLVKLGEEEIELSTLYKFHGDKLREGNVQKLLDNTASEILGKSVKIVVTIQEKN